MLYDILKILKKIAKFWYIYVATIVLGFAIYAFLPKTQKIINYTYTNQFQIEIFDNLDVEYYKFAQDQVLDTVVRNQSKIKENLGKNANTSFSIDKSDVNVLQVTITAQTKEDCQLDYKIVKEAICEYVKANLLENYVHVKTEIYTSQIGTEAQSINSIRKDFSTLFKIFIFLVFVEMVGFGVWGAIDDKIISQDELKFKFSKKIIIENKQSESEFYKFKLKQFEKENKKVEILDNINKPKWRLSPEEKQKLLVSDIVVIEIVLNKTKESSISNVVEFLDSNNKNEVYFVVDKKNKEAKSENSSNK